MGEEAQIGRRQHRDGGDRHRWTAVAALNGNILAVRRAIGRKAGAEARRRGGAEARRRGGAVYQPYPFRADGNATGSGAVPDHAGHRHSTMALRDIDTALVFACNKGKEAVLGADPEVTELRLVVTAEDYDEALRFYRDVLGLREQAAFSSPGGRVTILEAGRATLELADPPHAAYIDEVEVGRRVAGHIRVAFQVRDTAESTRTLAAAGAAVIAVPTRTPWDSLNSRLAGPADLQLTLFTDIEDG